MRPLGGLLFGYIGDKYSRKKALLISVIMMALTSFAIGCLPTYDVIGVAAPILLTLVRLLQGMSVGGEFVGSMLFTVESAPTNRRGLYGSACLGSACLGLTLGVGMAALLRETLSNEAMLTWGWRLPFLLGIIVGFIGVFVRMKLHEPPIFEKMKKIGLSSNPILDAIRNYPNQILLVMAVGMLWCSSIWMVTTFIPTYLTSLATIPTPHGSLISACSQMFLIVAFPCFGYLADLKGRLPIMFIGASAYTLFIVPIFIVLTLGQVVWAVLSLLLLALILCFVGAPLPTWMVEAFPPKVRYSAVAIGYNFSQAIFGGTTPLIATGLMATQIEFAPSFYLVLTAIGTGVGLVVAKRISPVPKYVDAE